MTMSRHRKTTRDTLSDIGEELFGEWGWQTRMAEHLGVNISSVKRWIAGTTDVPAPVIKALELLLIQKRHPELDYPELEKAFNKTKVR